MPFIDLMNYFFALLFVVACCFAEPIAKVKFSFSTKNAQNCLNETNLETAGDREKMLCEHLLDGGNSILWDSDDYIDPTIVQVGAVGHNVGGRGLDSEMFVTPRCKGGITGNFNDWSVKTMDASTSGDVWSITIEDNDFVKGYDIQVRSKEGSRGA